MTFDGVGCYYLVLLPRHTPVSWLEYRVENLTDTSATIHIDVVNADRINPDLYGTTLRLSSGDTATTNLAHADINVSLLVWQALTFDDTFGVETYCSKNNSIQLQAKTI